MLSTVEVTVGSQVWEVQVETFCPVLAEHGGMIAYGCGSLLARQRWSIGEMGGMAGIWQPVTVAPEGGNGVYVSFTSNYPDAMRAAARWAQASHLLDQAGRVTDVGREVLYGTVAR